MNDDLHDAIVTLGVSKPRCLFGVLTTAILGILLFVISFASPPEETVWLVVLWTAGAASVWASLALWRSADYALVLTDQALLAKDGTVLCSLDEVVAVERGFAAFKPSGGFLIRLNQKRSRAWVPGVWWRGGRRIGVGGVTRAGDARAMADLIAAMKASRDKV